MKRNAKIGMVAGIVAAALLLTGLVVGCGEDTTAVTTTGATTETATVAVGVTTIGAVAGGTDTTTAGAGTTTSSTDSSRPAMDHTAESLSVEEQEALLYLAEEEKLAHDVYIVLYEKWGTRVFDNISDSETKHMSSVQSLLQNYGLTDPVASTEAGVFANAELQELYETLITQGSASRAEALKVGVAIETKDIEDLEGLLALTDRSDIEEVARNLLSGSRNHLAAFGG